MNITEAILNLKNQIKVENIIPHEGLGTELFLFTSTLTPIINIDLFITNEQGQFLTTWREDRWYGTGWHLPGGCVRFKETIMDRAHRTAIDELGVDVEVNPVHLLLTEHIDDGNIDITVREHFLSILFGCKIINPEKLRNVDGKQIKDHVCWFDKILEDLLPAQNYYREYIQNWLNEQQ